MTLTKKQKIKFRFFILLAIILLAGFVCVNIPFNKINNFIFNPYATVEELENLSSSYYFGPFITTKITENDKMASSITSENDKTNFEPEIQFKLFNLIPIKTQKVKLIKEDKVLVGGKAVGIVLNMKGVLIVGSSVVSTEDGEIDILSYGNLKLGDIITKIEDEDVENVSSISKIINKEENKDKELVIKGIRNGNAFETKVKPLYDIKNNNYKLGVWVRDDASGIGTITYINSNNRFGALGHPICDSDTKSIINLKDGKIYSCSVVGVNKGSSGAPGELKGFFMQGRDENGVIEKNNNYGVFGFVENDSSILKDLDEIEVGGRLSVKPGKAKLRCCLNGNDVEDFDIEIIKTNYQNNSNSKSMVIRVIDKELINRTGGIVQGMSGSPIIQDNKIVGAVTHVFVSDPTKGFGIYIDWMLAQ